MSIRRASCMSAERPNGRTPHRGDESLGAKWSLARSPLSFASASEFKMNKPYLTQAEADSLIAMEKHRQDDRKWKYPDLGGKLEIPLHSLDRREQFTLDVRRGRIDLQKNTLQTRGRRTVVLVRLDFRGAPHRNPDGQLIDSSHIHIYREGFGDKWAVPLPNKQFKNMEDTWQAVEDFMAFCNITKPPFITGGLFT